MLADGCRRPRREAVQPLPSWARSLAGSMPAHDRRASGARSANAPEPARSQAPRRRCAGSPRTPTIAPTPRRTPRSTPAAPGSTTARSRRFATATIPGWSDRRAGRARVRPQDDRRFGFGHRRRVRRAGRRHSARRRPPRWSCLMAYANFQDRLLLCLGAAVEPGGPLPPVDVAFSPGASSSHANPAKPAPPRSVAARNRPGKDLVDDDPEWAGATYDGFRPGWKQQRSRASRLRVPSWEEVSAACPPGCHASATGSSGTWSPSGYSARAGRRLGDLMRSQRSKSTAGEFDRVFGLSLFWVTTRRSNCPYCMGHCEMNWEVAGLTQAADRRAEPAARRRRLVELPAGGAACLRLRPEADADPRRRSRPRTSRASDATSARDAADHRPGRLPVPLHGPHLQRLPAHPGADNVFYDYYADDKEKSPPDQKGSRR